MTAPTQPFTPPDAGAPAPTGSRSSGARAALITGVVLGLLVLVLAPFVPGLFTPDPAVADLVTFLLIWVAVLQPVGAVAFVLDGVLIGAGDQRFLAVAMAAAAGAMLVALVPVLPLGLGIGWVWAAFGVFMGARALVLLARFRTDAWLVAGAVR